ncbi:hypothetical protein D8B26_003155 [Coccidioides posadasii str. Silveira]|uniref:uncharacterized protein n=1 Tax=Coccidioides posadasii (strain RMSCC 757 / Silveira) TaxID=443226 RepID=UPI001BF00382|nr:hypothetical protein D8B26_003155 [Coccidioides posadasii str. Silveira]
MASRLYYYEPTTPPTFLGGENYPETVHSRSTSGSSSLYTLDSSPDSVITNVTTPNRSPSYYRHGRALLPKIRPQDLVDEPVSQRGPQRHRKALASTLNPPGYAPYPVSRPPAQRVVTDSAGPLVSPISTASFLGSHFGSTLPSPVTVPPVESRKRSSHSRNVSVSSIDETTLNRYGYPTYRQLPKYVSQCSPTSPVSSMAPSYLNYPPPKREPLSYQPYDNTLGTYSLSGATGKTLGAPVSIESQVDYAPPSTTLLEYLTAPTQAVNLVQNVAYNASRLNQTHFWWDVRNLRRWSSFSLVTLNEIPNFTKLLTTEIPQDLAPRTHVSSSRLAPDSEFALANLVRDIYAPRVNAALRVSQGRDSMALYPAPDAVADHENGPHFLANYPSDTEVTASGSPRGRVVGLVKSFDRWNTGMRNEQPHRRVEYLNGLSHLQRCMREHSCRYGFIMTEIELVCVRAGCDEGDDVPYFGYLELAPPIATKTSSASYNSLGASSLEQNYPSSAGFSGPLTATLALYYLLMLSKRVPLPGQASWHLNVGGTGALTRQRILPEGKDKWIPEPQQRERREAKRIRGWVMPQDAWHRREGGGASRTKAAKAKKWHK